MWSALTSIGDAGRMLGAAGGRRRCGHGGFWHDPDECGDAEPRLAFGGT
jgi:hypothetical protein